MWRAAAQRSLSEGIGVEALEIPAVSGAGPRLQIAKRSMIEAISRAVVLPSPNWGWSAGCGPVGSL